MSFVEFVETLKAHSTTDGYSRAIRKFLESVYRRAINPGDLPELADAYIAEESEHAKHLLKFIRGHKGAPVLISCRLI
jgi:hypothetical protein